ncbi:MAG: chromosome segregation protein SMC [Burkholderiaceae bacterium]
MRLKQIKLSGFKSFVDPTSLLVSSQLVGVVGPNGCGKSNVIDAVRWVLGESKASELRGDSMQDVIFSGSSDRKPSSRASVELIFDNSLGRIGGVWGEYAEISVRRILTRDNQSTYQINNQTVRRRDVYDMFLGTGLGPRAYGIIGQGTISRLIEAKPEELRIYLEEAAGVSKYKERRKETESRLASTRDNLTRVEDIDRELTSRIERLHKQAEVAGRYKKMDEDRLKKQRMLWLVKRNDARDNQVKAAASTAQAATELEHTISQLRATETRAEAIRQQYEEAGSAVHSAQGAYYEANAEVSRIEAEITRITENTEQLRNQIQRFDLEVESLSQRESETTEQFEQTTARLAQAREQSNIASAAVEARRAELRSASERLLQASATLEQTRAAENENRRILELAEAQKRSAVDQLESVANRRARARGEEHELSVFDVGSLDSAKLAVTVALARESDAGTQVSELQKAWSDNEIQRAPAQQALREAEAKFAQVDARIDALRDLQNRLDRQNDMHDWLAQREMGELQPVWQRLRVSDDWDAAVENILREKVSAIEISDLHRGVGLAAEQPPAKLVLFTADAKGAALSAEQPSGLKPLSAVVQCQDDSVRRHISDWLHGCYLAESLEDAMRRRSLLPAGAEFVVRDGHRVSASSIQLFAADNEREGVLKRQHELENLSRDRRAHELRVEETKNNAAKIESAAASQKAALDRAQSEQAQLARDLSSAQILAQRYEQQADQVRLDKERLAKVVAECDAEKERLETLLTSLDTDLEERASQAQNLSAQTESARSELALTDEQVSALRDSLREAETSEQQAQFDVRSMSDAVERFNQSLAEIKERSVQLTQDLAIAREQLGGLDNETPNEQLQICLQTRTEREQALSQARQKQEELAGELRVVDEKRMTLEREREPMMQRGTDLQLKEQAARLAVEQFQEQLDEAGIDQAAEGLLSASFAETPKSGWLQSEVARLNKQIESLGAVNLAALEELEEASERKDFLDKQLADLNEAIDTLEDAIRRIDKETRELLQETFDSVNKHFGTLFPELFGGGDARLELTGEEILDAGITVMAHPPGKRNTSIHLLSGGEKALTAIALVFALFQLNPAPFCMLDEVDAPLDDANTERYRNMVTRMSEQTQFVFISHNKIAMEMAQQLIGVTMAERGVSRIVAVDLDQAAEFAEAA